MVKVLKTENQSQGHTLAYEVEEENQQWVAKAVVFLKVRYYREIKNLNKVESHTIDIRDWENWEHQQKL